MEKIYINKHGSYGSGSGSEGSVGPHSSHHRRESVSYCAGTDDMQVQHKRQFTSVQLRSSRGLSLRYKM